MFGRHCPPYKQFVKSHGTDGGAGSGLPVLNGTVVPWGVLGAAWVGVPWGVPGVVWSEVPWGVPGVIWTGVPGAAWVGAFWGVPGSIIRLDVPGIVITLGEAG